MDDEIVKWANATSIVLDKLEKLRAEKRQLREALTEIQRYCGLAADGGLVFYQSPLDDLILQAVSKALSETEGTV